jgi:hypothetical protein
MCINNYRIGASLISALDIPLTNPHLIIKTVFAAKAAMTSIRPCALPDVNIDCHCIRDFPPRVKRAGNQRKNHIFTPAKSPSLQRAGPLFPIMSAIIIF